MGLKIETPEDIKKLGTILVIGAHPDDESFLAGGIMATAVKHGQTVVCVTATKGEQGSQDEAKWPTAKLSEIRTKEMANALKALGVKNHYWLGYPDGGCADIPLRQGVGEVADIVTRFKPDTILTFGPEGMTGHPDHQAVSEWAKGAIDSVPFNINLFWAVETHGHYKNYTKKTDEKLNIFFNIDEPPLVAEEQCDILYKLPEGIRQKKFAALAAMPSQTESMLKLTGHKYMLESISTEFFVLA